MSKHIHCLSQLYYYAKHFISLIYETDVLPFVTVYCSLYLYLSK